VPDLPRRFDSPQHLLPLIAGLSSAAASWACAWAALALGSACAGPTDLAKQSPEGRADLLGGDGVTLPGVAVGDRALAAHAFAAEASFLFPEESRALAHALLRAEFARLEAERLGVEPEVAAVDAALAASVAGLRTRAPGGQIEEWAMQRYGRGWEAVEAGLRKRLEDNQRFQLCARAWSLQQGRVQFRMLSTRDEITAQDWLRRIRAGASAAAMVSASLDAGPAGDGSLPWLPQASAGWIPAMLVPSELKLGEVFGPVQLPGESVWRVLEVLALEAPLATVPPRAQLLEALRVEPVGPLEERAWFEAMSARYNAREGLPAFETPARSFVRPRTR
jgi:hypothetical protein